VARADRLCSDSPVARVLVPEHPGSCCLLPRPTSAAAGSGHGRSSERQAVGHELLVPESRTGEQGVAADGARLWQRSACQRRR
jgi:hypothetical protein